MKSSRVLFNANVSNVSTRSRSRLQSDQQSTTSKAGCKPKVSGVASKLMLSQQKRGNKLSNQTCDENKENVDQRLAVTSKDRKRAIESPQTKVPPNKKPILTSKDVAENVAPTKGAEKPHQGSSRRSTRSSSRLQELADRENLSANASLSEEATEVEQTQPEAATSDNTEVEKKESSVRRKSASLSRDELMRRLDEVLVRNEPEETVKTHVEAFQNVGIAIKLEESKSLKLDDLSSQSSQSSQESEAMFSEENSEQEEEQELLPCPKKALELDYDKCNILQPLLNPVYIRDIFNFLKSREVHFGFSDYLPKQPFITAKMRTIVTDWLLMVQEPLLVQHETIHLAIKICDHYLMRKQILKSSYQLLAITSLFIACKFDERIHGSVEEFLNLCNNIYSKHEMIKLESDILRRLKYDLGFPLAYRFLRRYSNVQNNSFTVLCQARFILECSLLEYSFCSISDSLLAASCLMLAHLTLESGTWCPQAELASGYKRQELVSTMKLLNENAKHIKSLYWKQQKFFVFRKYCGPLFKRVALNSLLESEDIR